MRDPDLVTRAQRAAAALERAWERWRVMHGLAAEPAAPVSSYVGYSISEPWGRPRVVFGIGAREAELLAALLEHHECIGPASRGGAGQQAGGNYAAAPPVTSRAALAEARSRIPAQAEAAGQEPGRQWALEAHGGPGGLLDRDAPGEASRDRPRVPAGEPGGDQPDHAPAGGRSGDPRRGRRTEGGRLSRRERRAASRQRPAAPREPSAGPARPEYGEPAGVTAPEETWQPAAGATLGAGTADAVRPAGEPGPANGGWPAEAAGLDEGTPHGRYEAGDRHPGAGPGADDPPGPAAGASRGQFGHAGPDPATHPYPDVARLRPASAGIPARNLASGDGDAGQAASDLAAGQLSQGLAQGHTGAGPARATGQPPPGYPVPDPAAAAGQPPPPGYPAPDPAAAGHAPPPGYPAADPAAAAGEAPAARYAAQHPAAAAGQPPPGYPAPDPAAAASHASPPGYAALDPAAAGGEAPAARYAAQHPAADEPGGNGPAGYASTDSAVSYTGPGTGAGYAGLESPADHAGGEPAGPEPGHAGPYSAVDFAGAGRAIDYRPAGYGSADPAAGGDPGARFPAQDAVAGPASSDIAPAPGWGGWPGGDDNEDTEPGAVAYPLRDQAPAPGRPADQADGALHTGYLDAEYAGRDPEARYPGREPDASHEAHPGHTGAAGHAATARSDQDGTRQAEGRRPPADPGLGAADAGRTDAAALDQLWSIGRDAPGQPATGTARTASAEPATPAGPARPGPGEARGTGQRDIAEVVARATGASLPRPDGMTARPGAIDAGSETIAAELAGWAAGELPGQASARLAAWAASGGVPAQGYRHAGTP